MIDEVKNYTNLYLIASPIILINETLLDQTCDYAYNAGMFFMPAYYQQIDNATSLGYTPASWFAAAKERYGDRLLGIYYYDEPGGNQLDMTNILPDYPVTSLPQSYLDYTNYYFWLWGHGSGGIGSAASIVHRQNASLLTADYGLYWFDYELGYDTVLAEFGSNNSRPLQISLVRGAAEAQNKSWGAIITWTYNHSPYLESAVQMYSDMVLAYDSGASCIAIYDSSHNYANTTLTPDDFTKLQNFWNYVQHNPDKHGSLKADTAVVLPQDYGFGFRSPDDSVWQYHQADNWTRKMYSDVTSLLNQYNSSLDIVYSDQEFQNLIQSRYSKVLYWPKNFEANTDYPVVNLNNGLGYNTIQEAISSFATYATYAGDTISVKPGTYQENIVITKPVALTSQNKGNTIIDGPGKGAALTIASDNVTVTGFTVQNGGNLSGAMGAGILLQNSNNCTITNNTVTNNYKGIVFDNSSDNVLKGNNIGDNMFNLVFLNALTTNNIDTSNIVDGKPYTNG